MKELFRLNVGKLKDNYDIWITIQRPFYKNDYNMIERLFLDALKSIQDD